MFGGSFDKAFKNHHVISATDETLVANPAKFDKNHT
jgi:hypothetical protein